MAENEKSGVAMVDRAMQILDYICSQNEPASLTDISYALSLPKASVFRILNTLVEWDAVECVGPEKHYRLGIQMVKLGRKARSEIPFVDICVPYMSALVEQHSESVNLGVEHDRQALNIHVESPRGAVLAYRQIPTSPLHCSSIGKIFLSRFSPEALQAYFASDAIEKRTPNTITTAKDFEPQRQRILEEGISYDNEEYEIGLSCISCPIIDNSGRVLACIGVSGPTSRIQAKQKDLESALRKAADGISQKASLLLG